MAKKPNLKSFLIQIDDLLLSKTRKKMNKKSHKGRYYGGVGGYGCNGSDAVGGGDAGGIGESESHTTFKILTELVAYRMMSGEENAEQTISKIEMARRIFQQMIYQGAERQDIIDAMMRHAQVTHSTAVSYYERIAREFGLTNQSGDENASDDVSSTPEMTASNSRYRREYEDEDDMHQDITDQLPGEIDVDDNLKQEIQHTYPDDPNKQGIIRTVDRAHLVYKRQTPDGTFEELWIYNIDTDMRDELTIRRNILAGTDIPAQKTKSPDGTQRYTLTTMGNAQMLHIFGLPN